MSPASPQYVEFTEDEVTLAAETCALPGGRVGYYQRDINSCMRGAVATALQVPYDEVPDTAPPGRGGYAEALQIYARLWEWAAQRHLRMEFLADLPQFEKGELWIGVSPLGSDGFRHVIVICDGQAYFDPAAGWQVPEGCRVAVTREIEYGIIFHPTEETP